MYDVTNAKLYILILEIAYNSKELRNIFEDSTKSKEYFGETNSTIFRARVADLEAASNIYEIPLGVTTTPINGLDTKAHYKINDNIWILFSANHFENPKNHDDTINWNEVFRIKILDIGDKYE